MVGGHRFPLPMLALLDNFRLFEELLRPTHDFPVVAQLRCCPVGESKLNNEGRSSLSVTHNGKVVSDVADP